METPTQNQAPKQATIPEKQEKNRKMLRTAGIVLILVVIAALIGNNKWKQSSQTAMTGTEDCKAGDLFSQSTGKPCPQSADLTADVSGAATAGPSGYEEAIRMYAGKVVIFDAACKSLPATSSFAVGTRILVANNSAKSATLAVGDKSETLGAYHYFTYQLKTAGDIVVSCNGAPAAAISVK